MQAGQERVWRHSLHCLGSSMAKKTWREENSLRQNSDQLQPLNGARRRDTATLPTRGEEGTGCPTQAVGDMVSSEYLSSHKSDRRVAAPHAMPIKVMYQDKSRCFALVVVYLWPTVYASKNIRITISQTFLKECCP